MTKKKLLTLIAVILVLVATASVLLIGCKPKPEPDPDPETKPTFTEAMDQIVDGVTAGIGDMNLSNLGLGFNLTIDSSVGSEKKKYDVSLAFNLDLAMTFKTAPTFTRDETTGAITALADAGELAPVADETYNNWISLAVKENGKTVLTFNYKESKDAVVSPPSNRDYRNGQYATLQFMSGDKLLTKDIYAPSIKEVLRQEWTRSTANGGYTGWIDFEAISKEIDGVDFAEEIGTIGGIIVDSESIEVSESKIKFSMPLSSVIDEVIGMFATADLGPLMEMLSLQKDLGSKLTEILPTIKLDWEFDFANKIVNNVKVNVSISEKHVVINHTNPTEDGAFIDFTIPGDVNAAMSLGITYNPTYKNILGEITERSWIHALNAEIGGEFELDKAITNTISGDIGLNIPAGTYTFGLKIDADPTQLIGMDFTNIGNDFESIFGVISDVVNCIYNLDLQVTNKATGDKLINIQIDKNNGGLLSIKALSGITLDLPKVASVSTLLNNLKTIIGELFPTPAATAESDNILDQLPENITPVLEQVGKYLKMVSVTYKDEELKLNLKDITIDAGNGISLMLGVKAVVNANGLVADIHFANSGAALQEKDKLDHNLKLTISKISYGTVPTSNPNL